jgi:DNA-binding GntR family transcriptional regulator
MKALTARPARRAVSPKPAIRIRRPTVDEVLDDHSMHIRAVAAPVRQQVFSMMRAAIISGRFHPGQRLLEKDLCELMGVSRPSVREALRHLESEGLIETIANRGPVVARLSWKDAISIYQVRGALEALATRLFAAEASAEEVAELDAAFNEIARAMKSGDVEKILPAKDRFYSVLFRGSRNAIISAILGTMNARITLLRRVSLSSADRAPETLKEIKAVVMAIKRRDPEAAYKASFTHVAKAAKVALAGLSAEDETDAPAGDR